MSYSARMRLRTCLGAAGLWLVLGPSGALQAETFPMAETWNRSYRTEARGSGVEILRLTGPGRGVDLVGIGDPAERERLEPLEPLETTAEGEADELAWLPQRLGVDLVDLVRAPRALSRRDWTKLGLGLAAIGGVALFDDEIRSAVARDTPDSVDFARQVRPLGQEGGLALLALTWSYGKASNRPRLVAVAQDGLEATILSAGVLAPLLKNAVGRSRPRSQLGSVSFSGSESFPSGEVAEAFAIASVVAAHSESRAVDALAYGLASVIAWQRMRLDAHWASDVTAGALLGIAVGHWVVRRNHPDVLEGPRLEWAPLVGDQSYGLSLRWTF